MIKLKNTDKAVKRLALALKNGEKIGIWSDYDPDGTFALALAYEALLNAGFEKKNLVLSLPNQFKFKRSFNKFHLKVFKKARIKLILGIDFGTTDFKEVGWAKKMGFEIILLDHHRQRPGNLPALLINPWQKGDSSKTKNWSGAGVAYLFFENFYKSLKLDLKKLENSIDLILIPALTDYIAINKGNLPHLKKSLKKINAGKRPGLNASLKQIGLNKKNLSIKDLERKRPVLCDFYGTLEGNGKSNNVLKLLLSGDKSKAEKISNKIKKEFLIFERYVNSVVKQGVKKFSSKKDLKFILWGTDKDIRMIGAGSKIATGLNSHFKVPVYFYNKEKAIMKGSIRAGFSKNFNVVDSLKITPELFIAFGGHPRAAGFYILKNNLPALERSLEKFYSDHSISVSKKQLFS